MKLSHILSLIPLFLMGTPSGATRLSSGLTDREAIIDTVLAFGQSLDDKNESLMRSVTTQGIIFDGTLFADIGLGAPEPLVGQDVVASSLLGVLTMATSHHLGNFRIQPLDLNRANLTVYVLAHHHKQLEDPRQNPRNLYVMGNRWQAAVVKDKGNWKLGWLKILPVWQSGNIAVMGLEE
ncbi:hypothetical protein B0T26DRAFT_669536 [Lasiosphaeria miniovina]|uniref:SnoaL-like domain-containing protein n=1 Tax=Lasiosphaeria miniovina TaxID=1954250 RepID=A0AA40ECC3_9PEZI|nr:uncharacterized protein B0T26DRAFT_669536 [Lasiosphaeria miniovina]KAK0733087.1 hypothetical protein B0T26DRAFT_669536 [Lasiosphaeria miniovina]